MPRQNKLHNDDIKPPTPNRKKVTFNKEPNGIYDTGATSGVETLKDGNYFITTGKNSNTVFVIPNSDTMSATERIKLAHKLRDPEEEMDIVPEVLYTLLSGVKNSDADYAKIFDKEDINIDYGKTTKIIISEKAVLSGYHTEEGLWFIPLKKMSKVSTSIHF